MGGRRRHLRGPVLPVRGPHDRAEAGPASRTRRSGSAAAPSRPRRSTARRVDTIRPVLRRIAKYASTWVPHSSATAEMVAGGLGDHPRGDGGVRARPGRDDQGLLELRARPRAGRGARVGGARSSRSTPGWTCRTGRSSTCSARPRRWPSGSGARSRRSVAWSTSSSTRSTGTRDPRATRRRRPAARPRLTRPMGSYLRPTTLEEALVALAGGAPRTLLAGGTDCYPARVGRPVDEDVLDVTGLPDLRAIDLVDGVWRIPARADLDRPRPADLPPAFDGLKAAAAGHRRGPDPAPRDVVRQRLQRLAGRGRAARTCWPSTRASSWRRGRVAGSSPWGRS